MMKVPSSASIFTYIPAKEQGKTAEVEVCETSLALESGLVGLLSKQRRKRETTQQHAFRRAVGIIACLTILSTLVGALVSLSGRFPEGVVNSNQGLNVKASSFVGVSDGSDNSDRDHSGTATGGDGQCRGLYGIARHGIDPDKDYDPDPYILGLYNPGPIWSWFFGFIPVVVHAALGLIPYVGPVAEAGFEIAKWVLSIEAACDAASQTPDSWSGYVMICYLIFSFNMRALCGPVVAHYAYYGNLEGSDDTVPIKFLVACGFTALFFLFAFAACFIAVGVYCVVGIVVCLLIWCMFGDGDLDMGFVVGLIGMGLFFFSIWVWGSASLHVWVDPNCGPFAAMGLEVSKRGLGFAEWFASAAKSKYGATDVMALFL